MLFFCLELVEEVLEWLRKHFVRTAGLLRVNEVIKKQLKCGPIFLRITTRQRVVRTIRFPNLCEYGTDNLSKIFTTELADQNFYVAVRRDHSVLIDAGLITVSGPPAHLNHRRSHGENSKGFDRRAQS